MSDTMKPCPFCGGEACAAKDDYGKVLIFCETCGLYFGISIEDGCELVDGWRATFHDVETAVTAWNERADINPEKGLKESEEWCADCDHIEMCRWYPTQGCEFKSGLHPELRQKWSKQGLYPDGFGGVKVGYTCPYCHKYVPYAGKFCGKCGMPVQGGEDDAAIH